MEERNTFVVLILMVITFGIYGIFWMWKTTKELREETGRKDLRPGVDFLLFLMTLGIWGIWVGYRNAEIVHEELLGRSEKHNDRSLFVLGIGLLTWVTGCSWLVMAALLQEDYNRLANTDLFFEDPFEGLASNFGSVG